MSLSPNPSRPAPAAPGAVPGRATVVVIDDEPNMGTILERILARDGYLVTAFSDPVAAVEHIRAHPPDLVVTDMKMPVLTGMDVLAATRAARPATGIIVMTGYGTIEGAIDAMKAGAYDYITKPFKSDELLIVLTKALERTRLEEQNETLSDTLLRPPGGGAPGAGDILGESSAIRAALATIDKVAPTDAAVLIRGESGTGKELVARRLHQGSPRRGKKFVAINCASIPEALLESELFGHEKGAFTGADRTKMGLVELAQGGTLFLDEIGELPLTLQAKMLRVLQEREIQRVGGLRTIPIDVRLLAATNRDLKAAIEAKEFRADLYFRLDVISLVLPPLRERRGDVPMLARRFVERSGRRLGQPNLTISDAAVSLLDGYDFPGNIRELENVVERMAVLCHGQRIEADDVPRDIRGASDDRDPGSDTPGAPGSTPVPPPPGGYSTPATDPPGGAVEYRDAKDAFERDYLRRAIAAAKGNISEAARLSGISRRHFYEKLEKLGIAVER